MYVCVCGAAWVCVCTSPGEGGRVFDEPMNLQDAVVELNSNKTSEGGTANKILIMNLFMRK